ncbi:MAG TPA: hypothetical protein VHV49_06545 [Pseudonocardiaceae bacterium]|nr:hypothetical protein [Pseudonocardiaceae bacterium]
MHTWVRRGLQTALVTGGLLMLGTGIASADENVNPDQPPSPVDAGVSVPIDAGQNAIGTPLGQYQAPSVQRTVSTGDVTGGLPGGTGGLSTDALPAKAVTGHLPGDATKALPTNAVTKSLPTRSLPTQSVTGQANPLFRQARPDLRSVGGQTGLFRGNRVVADVVVPVQICGNAVAVGGDASESGVCGQTAGHSDPITTNGDGQALAGNVVAGNATIPVQLTGNAVAAAGNAVAHSVAGQSGTTGGNIRTSGDAGVVSGTVAAVQWATPVQVADNAVSGAGVAGADSASESDATSKGSLRTSGKSGTGAGTIAGVPVAVPAQVDGNGVSGIGNAASKSTTTANSTAGTTNAHNIGLWGHPTWALTNGDPSTASGNVAQPQVSGPASLDDNAAGAIGNTSADSTNNSTDSAGGLSSTTGQGSTGSGNFADAPVALPTSGGGNAVTGVGNAATSHTTNVASAAGGDTLTNGDNSTLSGNSANVPPAGAVDVCGDAAGGVGGAGGSCDNNVTSTTGGYNGTTGNNSTGSGNEGQTPVSAPVESYGTAVSGAGNATSGADETKSVSSGGDANSEDDNGTLTSNVVSTPTAVPAQVFGDAAGVVGNSGVTTDNDTVTKAGGKANATGRNATGAGNIVFVPTSAPTQAFGDSDMVVGNGSTMTDSSTTSTAGGRAHSTGVGGAGSGNVVQVAAQPVDQVFGEAGNAVGIGGDNTGNALDSTAGGITSTDGDHGAVAGNAVVVPATAANQVFGDAASAAGLDTANGTNVSDLTTGGQVSSSGIQGTGAGNVLTVPVESDPDAFGDAVAAAGKGTGVAENDSVLNNGGDSKTRGGGFLSAYNFNEPLGPNLNVEDAPVPVLGDAETMVEDDSVVNNGFDRADDSEMALPGGFGGAMGYGMVTPDFPTLPTGTILGNVPTVPSFDGAPGMSTQSAPAAPSAQVPGLPSTPRLPGVPQVPQVPLVQGAVGQAGHLPVGNAVGVPTSAVRGAQTLSKAGTGMNGVSGLSGISGVLPVHSDLLPRI